MSDVTPRKVVAEYAQLMEQKLVENDGRPGWRTESIEYLQRRLNEEIVELYQAIQYGVADQFVQREAADVGNLAMMIADAYQHQKLGAKT